MTAYLGIDIAKASFMVALHRPQRQVVYAEFANTPAGFRQLQGWLREQQAPQVHACLEATGRYGQALAHALYDQQQAVSMINPAQSKAFAKVLARRSKNDRVDAEVLARYAQQLQPGLWSPPDPAQARLQQLTRQRQTVLQLQQADRNRLHAGRLDPVVKQLLQQRLTLYADQLTALQAEIDAHIAAHAVLRRRQHLLTSIPGIGKVTAAVLLGELPEIGRFHRASQLVAYAGLDPSQHRSGTSVNKPTRISKQGNARLRTALYFPGVVGMARCAVYQPLVARLKAHQHCNMSIIVAVMRKLLHLVFGILKHERPFDPHYQQLRVLPT